MSCEQSLNFEPWDSRAVTDNEIGRVVLYNGLDEDQKLTTTQQSGNRITEFLGGEIVYEFNTGETVTWYRDGGMRIVVPDGTIVELPTSAAVEYFIEDHDRPITPSDAA